MTKIYRQNDWICKNFNLMCHKTYTVFIFYLDFKIFLLCNQIVLQFWKQGIKDLYYFQPPTWNTLAQVASKVYR